MMMKSLNTTIEYENQGDSYVSFYEYPHHQSLINSRFQAEIVALPTSNRDELVDSLESLALKIKTLENQRKQAERTFQEITGKCTQPTRNSVRSRTPEDFRVSSSFKIQNNGKNKRTSQQNHSDTPFILGKSTTPSHNVKSNIQTVIALLKSHNHQLCLSSKEYVKNLHTHRKNHLTSHDLLYLDHYKRTSVSPRRCDSTKNSQHHSRIEHLLNEYIKLFRKQTKFHLCRANSQELNSLNEKMETILDELKYLQSQNKHETCGRSKFFQMILKEK
ncbi:unnamed protein product [Adineta ricciae]|uniref:Cep57 centrosome microtubule-binding domain-containing protein n=1 Tax=Adineta ricciae TaxID=249248 RepID=A0A814YWG6_ADIRI|nr:unnamed protein product [Adineta ricciae]CAF1649545.1 unnamed protein product [Adineta ricciae]